MAEPNRPSCRSRRTDPPSVQMVHGSSQTSMRKTGLHAVKTVVSSLRSVLPVSVRCCGSTVGTTVAMANSTANRPASGTSRERRRSAIRSPVAARMSPASMIVAGGPIEPSSHTTTKHASAAPTRSAK